MADEKSDAGVAAYYKEQLDQARHIEVQRTAIGGFTVAFSGVIVSKLQSANFDRTILPYTITLTLIGLTALLLSAKLYERFRWHHDLGFRLREEINPQLGVLEKDTNDDWDKKYPVLFKIGLHTIWNCLFGGIALLGVVLTVKALLV